MPSTTHTPVRAFAHCTASRCPGNRQVEIDAIEEETSWLFSDNGGDWPFVEKSSVNLRFVNVEEQHCPTCGRSRDLSSTKRPAFDGSLSGYDPNGLLEMQANGIEFDPDKQAEIRAEAVTDPERDRMQNEIAELRGAVQALLAQSAPQPPAEPETAEGDAD
jgi:hypothetical protein